MSRKRTKARDKHQTVSAGHDNVASSSSEASNNKLRDSSGLNCEESLDCAALLREYCESSRVKARRGLVKLCCASPTESLPHRYLARVLLHEAACEDAAAGSDVSERRVPLLKQALDAACTASKLSPSSLSCCALYATLVLNVLVEESSARLLGSNRTDEQIKQEFKAAVTACSIALQHQNPVVVEPVLSISTANKTTLDPCSLRVQDQLAGWVREEKWEEIVKEKRIVLTALQQVLESCYTLLDSTQIPVDGIVRLLQHILRPHQQELQAWAGQLLIGQPANCDEVQRKVETQAAVAELLKLLKPPGGETKPPSPARMAQPLAEAAMILEKDWDAEKPQDSTAATRRKSKGKHGKTGQDKRKEKTQYERYMDVESFWKQISQQQRRELLRVPVASILEAVKKAGVPETTEALIEGLVLLREHNNRNARYWWCAVCDQKFQSCKDYLTHVELFHEELAQVDNHYLPCSKCQNHVVGMYWSSTKSPGHNLCFKCYTSQLHNPASSESVSGMQKVYPRSSAGIPAWSETSDFISTRDSFASFTDDESQQGNTGLDPMPTSMPSTSSLPLTTSTNLPLGPSSLPAPTSNAPATSKTPFFSRTNVFFPPDPSTLLMPHLQPPPATTSHQPSLATASQPPPLPNPTLAAAAPSTSTSDKPASTWTPDLSKYKHVLNLAEAPDPPATPNTATPQAASHAERDAPQTHPHAPAEPMLQLGTSQPQSDIDAHGSQSGQGSQPRGSQQAFGMSPPAGGDRLHPGTSSTNDSTSESLPVLALDTFLPLNLSDATSHATAVDQAGLLNADSNSISQLSSLSALNQDGSLSLPSSFDNPLLSTSEPLLSGFPPCWDQNLSALVSNVIETLSNGKAWTADSLLTHQALHAVAHAAAAAAAAASNNAQHSTSMASISEALAPALSAVGDGAPCSLEPTLLDPSLSSMLTARQLELVGSIQLVVSEVMKRMRVVYSVDRQLGQQTLESVKQFIHRKLSASMEELCKAGNSELPGTLQLPPEMREFLVSPDTVLTQPDMLQVVLQCLHLQDLQMVLAYVVRQHTDVFSQQTQQRSAEDIGSEDLGDDEDGGDEDEEVDEDEDEVEDEDEEEQLDVDEPLEDGEMNLMQEEEEDDEDEDEDEEEEEIDDNDSRPPLLFQLCNADDRSFDKVMEEVWGAVPWGYNRSQDAADKDKINGGSHSNPGTLGGSAGESTKLKAEYGQNGSNHVVDKTATAHSCSHDGCCGPTGAVPVLEVVPWWVQHLSEQSAVIGEVDGEVGVLRWVYGKLVNSQMEQFAKRQGDLRGGRPREVVMLEVYEEIAFLWRQLQDFTDRRNRLEELRKSARYHFTRVKSLQEKGEHCTPEQACEFLAAILAAYYSQQQGGLQPHPLPPPSFPAQPNTPSTSTSSPALPPTVPPTGPPVLPPPEVITDATSTASTSDPGVPAPSTPEPPLAPSPSLPSPVPSLLPPTDPATPSTADTAPPASPSFPAPPPNPPAAAVPAPATLTHPPPPPYPPTPVPQPALYMCEAAVDVVRRHPQLAQEPSQIYTRALLDRELAVLSLAEAMLLHEAETAEREVSRAEEVVKKCSAEAGELELEYQRVQVEGPANHRKRDMLDKATKEAEHRERLQDLVNRIAALKDQMVSEQSNGAKWSSRLTDVRRELAALKEQLQGVSDRKRNLTEVCTQLELAVPTQETVAQRAARLECLMYRVLWVSEAVKLFHAQYAPGNPHFELFVKATNWAKALVVEYDSTVKAYCRELDTQRGKLQDLSCVDQSFEICAASLEVIKQQLEEAAMKAREEAAMSLLQELEQEEQQKKMLDDAGKKGGVEEGKAAAGSGKKSKSGKKAKAEKQRVKAVEAEEAKKKEAEIRAKEAEELRKEREKAWKAREEERERELERRKKELEEQEAALLRAAQEASLREAAEQKKKPETQTTTSSSASTSTAVTAESDANAAGPSASTSTTRQSSQPSPSEAKSNASIRPPSQPSPSQPRPAAAAAGHQSGGKTAVPSTPTVSTPTSATTPVRPTVTTPHTYTPAAAPLTPVTLPRSGPIKPHGTVTAEDFIPDEQLDAELKRAIELSKREHDRRQQEEVRQQRTLFASLSQNSNHSAAARPQAPLTHSQPLLSQPQPSPSQPQTPLSQPQPLLGQTPPPLSQSQQPLSQAQLARANQQQTSTLGNHNWETQSNATSTADSTDERQKRSVKRKAQSSPRTWATPPITPPKAPSPSKSQTDTAPSTRPVSRSNSTPAQSPSSRASSTSSAPYAVKQANGPGTPATAPHHPSSSFTTSPLNASPGAVLPVHLQFKSAAEAAAAAAASNLPKTKLRPSPVVKPTSQSHNPGIQTPGHTPPPPTYATKLLSDGSAPIPPAASTPTITTPPPSTPSDTPLSLPPAFPLIPPLNPPPSRSIRPAPDPSSTPTPPPPPPPPAIPAPTPPPPVPPPLAKPMPAYNPLTQQLPAAAIRAPTSTAPSAAIVAPRAFAPTDTLLSMHTSMHPPPPPPAQHRVSTPPDDAIVPPPSRPSPLDLIRLFPSTSSSLTAKAPSSHSLESCLSGPLSSAPLSSLNSTNLKPSPIAVDTSQPDMGRSFNPFAENPLQQALAKQTMSTQSSEPITNGLHTRPSMSRHNSAVYRNALSPSGADGSSPGMGPDITAIMSFLGEDATGAPLAPTKSTGSATSSIGASNSTPATPLPTPTALPPGNLGLGDARATNAISSSSAFTSSVFGTTFRRLPQSDAVPGAVSSAPLSAPTSSAPLPSPSPMMASPLTRPPSALSISTQPNPNTQQPGTNATLSSKMMGTNDDASSLGGSTPASTPSSSFQASMASTATAATGPLFAHAGSLQPSTSHAPHTSTAAAPHNAALTANGALPSFATSGVSGVGPWMMPPGLLNLAHAGMTPLNLINPAAMGGGLAMRPPTGLLMPGMYQAAIGTAVPQMGANPSWRMHPNMGAHDWLARRNTGLNTNMLMSGQQALSNMMLPQTAQFSPGGLLDNSMRRLSESQMGMGPHGITANALSHGLAGYPAGPAGYPTAGPTGYPTGGASGYPAGGPNAFSLALQQQLAGGGFSGWRGNNRGHPSSSYNATANGAPGSNVQFNNRGQGTGAGGGGGGGHHSAASGGGAGGRDAKHAFPQNDSASPGWKSRPANDVDTGKVRYNAES